MPKGTYVKAKDRATVKPKKIVVVRQASKKPKAKGRYA